LTIGSVENRTPASTPKALAAKPSAESVDKTWWNMAASPRRDEQIF